MSVAVAIMHVPTARGRPEIVRQLLAQWPHADVVEDRRREGAWPTARRAWERLAATGSTHALLLQDDAIPCDDMALQVLAARDAIPEGLLSFYTRRARFVATAREADSSWYWSPDGAYGLALLMPREWIHSMLAWGDREIEPSYPHDDNRVSLWARSSGCGVFVSCPSLVTHADLPSLLGHRWAHTPGLEWRGHDRAPIDWSRGASSPPRMRATVRTKGALLRGG